MFTAYRQSWRTHPGFNILFVCAMLAAWGVFGTGTRWPDLLVAAVMAGLALQGGWQVIRHARAELREVAEAAAVPVHG